MPKKRSNIGLIKEFVVKCRLEQRTGDLNSPDLHTYHTYVIAAKDRFGAIEEATSRAMQTASYPEVVVKIEYITGGI